MKRYSPLITILCMFVTGWGIGSLSFVAGCGAAKTHITHSSDDLSDNYLADIAPARWQDAEIRYYIAPQSASLPGLDIPRLADRAVHYWDDAIRPSRLVRVWNRTDANVTIDFERDSYFWADKEGLTGWTDIDVLPANGYRMKKAQVHILRSLWPIGMEANVIHEVGHALGVRGHSPDSGDVMYDIVPKPGKISRRDFNTVASLYRGLSAAQ